ncbi:MAG: protein kinase [Myxococcota bacterium]
MTRVSRIEPGQVIEEKYRIVRRIGEGGMGVVFEATRVTDGSRVAIKSLHRHLLDHKEMVKRFHRELQAATILQHRNIIQVGDVGRFEDGTFYMVLEYLEGRDMATDLAENGPMPVGRLVRIVEQICDALDVAHSQGIVHRDLKPDNVFLREGAEGDDVKVLDFGVSKFLDPAHQASLQTQTGTTVGTPFYMAPEQAQGKKDIDGRADLYALGVLMFRSLTGIHPFEDESYPMLVLKICTEPPPSIAEFRADLPAGLREAVERLLEKDPDQRFPAAAAVRQAFAPFRDASETPVLLDGATTRNLRPKALDRVDSPLARAKTEPAQTAWHSGAYPPPEDEPPPPPKGQRTQQSMRWVMFVVALVVIGGAFGLAMSWEGDREVDATPVLPDPKPPETTPLIAPGTGDIGWSWVNPLPRYMPTWYATAVAGPELVAMVGRFGRAARFQQGQMYSWTSGTDSSLFGVAWASAREAIAVGESGTIAVLRIDGEPEVIASGVDGDLYDIVTTSPTDAIAVGADGVILRLHALEATAVSSDSDQDLVAVTTWGQEAFAVGEGGTILRIRDGEVADESSGTDATLRAIGGCPAGGLYAAGDRGVVLRRTAEGQWRRVELGEREPILDIACGGNHAALVGRSGGLFLAEGNDTVRVDTGTDRALHSISFATGADTWIVGEGGRLLILEGDHVRTLTAGPTAPIQGLGAIGGALFAVGEWGRIVRQEERGFQQMRSPTKAALAGLAPLGRNRLVAVGDSGAVVELEYERARLARSPSDTGWRDVVSANESILAVGTNGSVMAGVLGALERRRLTDIGDLWALAGSPDDAYAVGNEGTVIHLVTGEPTRRIRCGTTRNLRGVFRQGGEVWACGEGGIVVRLSEGQCSIDREAETGAPTLFDIGLGPRGNILTVGDEGTAIVRDGDGWRAANLDVGGAGLRTIFETERELFIAGRGGVIVRHILLR